jgi:hypothetical protein
MARPPLEPDERRAIEAAFGCPCQGTVVSSVITVDHIYSERWRRESVFTVLALHPENTSHQLLIGPVTFGPALTA